MSRKGGLIQQIVKDEAIQRGEYGNRDGAESGARKEPDSWSPGVKMMLEPLEGALKSIFTLRTSDALI